MNKEQRQFGRGGGRWAFSVLGAGEQLGVNMVVRMDRTFMEETNPLLGRVIEYSVLCSVRGVESAAQFEDLGFNVWPG